jgi:putative NIF3 family GTP cyclohydrolase 1 type 2
MELSRRSFLMTGAGVPNLSRVASAFRLRAERSGGPPEPWRRLVRRKNPAGVALPSKGGSHEFDSFTGSRAAQSTLTAAQIIDRIRANVGVPWRTETVDKIIAGASDTPVTGIATTMMATLDVVERSAAAGRNFLITHEPTFYSHLDTTDTLQQDDTYRQKAEFLRSHDMAIFRFHDHWHARRPDGIATGMARELGWEKQIDPQNPRQFVFDGVPLAQFAKDIQTRLGIRTMRIVGDPKLAVRRVQASWGFASPMPGMTNFARSGVDVLVIGEAREWELVEYAQDCIKAGHRKALIVLGHVVSEQAGMKYCAEWLKGFISEVPIDFVAAQEPFWAPEHPVG